MEAHPGSLDDDVGTHQGVWYVTHVDSLLHQQWTEYYTRVRKIRDNMHGVNADAVCLHI
jgi:hypothetical protein